MHYNTQNPLFAPIYINMHEWPSSNLRVAMTALGRGDIMKKYTQR